MMIKGINKMLTKSKLEFLVGLGIIILPLQGLAAAAPTEMTKDDWLGKLKAVAPSVICQGFFEDASLKKRMEELKIDNDKCISLIPASFDKCQTQYYSGLPATMNKDSAAKWGHTIGECIGTDFATKYLVSNPQASTSSSSDQTTSSSTPSSTSPSTPSTSPSTPSTSPSSPISSSTPATSSDSQSTDISRDQWLAQLKTLAPAMICQGFFGDPSLKKKLEDRSIDNTKCVNLIPASFEKCQNELYSNLPTTLNSDSANTWGHKIGECIGTDFAKKYLLPTATPATSTSSQ